MGMEIFSNDKYTSKLDNIFKQINSMQAFYILYLFEKIKKKVSDKVKEIMTWAKKDYERIQAML